MPLPFTLVWGIALLPDDSVGRHLVICIRQTVACSTKKIKIKKQRMRASALSPP